jgi:lysozyme
MRGRVVALMALAAIAVVAAGGYVYYMRFSPDRDRYPLRGIDVSHHQGTIDWLAVAADDVAFAYIKASEGGDFVDRNFATNFVAATAAGLPAGAYHFFTLCRPGAEQAQNFLAQLPQGSAMLPPALDLEFSSGCDERPEPEAVVREIDAFLGVIEPALGRQAIFYSMGEFYEAYGAALPERPMWRRWIARPPGEENWLIWQYHNRGRVEGITGPVDLNVFSGDEAKLREMVK